MRASCSLNGMKKRESNTTVIMTSDEIKNLPPMSKKELKAFDDANIVYDEDCPELTDEQLRQFKPRYVNHPVSVHEKRKDGKICIPIDSDILKALKSPQKDYEKRINTILRRVVLG